MANIAQKGIDIHPRELNVHMRLHPWFETYKDNQIPKMTVHKYERKTSL